MNALTTQKFRHFLYQISQSGEYMNGHHWIPLAKELLSEIDNDNQAFISILNDEHKAFAHQYPESIVWRIGDDYSSLLWAHRWEGWQARAAIALAERTSSTGSAVVSDEQLLNKPLPELLGLYWDIAYSEGKTGVSRGTEAQCVLSSILSAAAAQPAQPERQAAGAMSDEQIFAIHDATNDSDSQILAFARAILAAAQPIQEPPSQQPVAWAAESTTGGAVRMLTKISLLESEVDKYVNRQDMASIGCNRVKVPLYAAAQAPAPTAAVQADSQPTSDEKRDAALLRAFIADPALGYRWRLYKGKRQWQVRHDGETWGKWGEFREVLNNWLSSRAAMSSEGGANG